MMIRSVAPSVTSPSPDEWPQDLIKTISNISRNNQAQVTSTSHGITSTSENVTFVSFKQVNGMIQINGLNALIVKVLDTDNVVVNIDSTNFYNYTSGGVMIVDSGLPPEQQESFRVFNRPFQNIAT